MIIFGTRGVTTTPDRGEFSCPQCGGTQPYKLKRVRRFFTLYFIPVIPLARQPVGFAAPACYTGVCLGAVGILLRTLAIRRLGPRFLDPVAVGASGHTLERDGVFARCRHPAEVGFLLILLGTAILSGSVPALVTWLLVVVPLVGYRTRLEDRLLVTHFGADAVAYQERVAAFGVAGRRRPPRVSLIPSAAAARPAGG